jgi:hypothetical protein
LPADWLFACIRDGRIQPCPEYPSVESEPQPQPQPQPVVLSVDGGLLLVSYHPLANILQAT